jgi:hypothetical protein
MSKPLPFKEKNRPQIAASLSPPMVPADRFPGMTRVNRRYGTMAWFLIKLIAKF